MSLIKISKQNKELYFCVYNGIQCEGLHTNELIIIIFIFFLIVYYLFRTSLPQQSHKTFTCTGISDRSWRSSTKFICTGLVFHVTYDRARAVAHHNNKLEAGLTHSRVVLARRNGHLKTADYGASSSRQQVITLFLLLLVLDLTQIGILHNIHRMQSWTAEELARWFAATRSACTMRCKKKIKLKLQ